MNNALRILISSLVLICLSPPTSSQPVVLRGELQTWHKITLLVEGPQVAETDASNPFLNYKVSGVFTQGEKSYVVPGYFAADGDAGNTGATGGNIWKIHFRPPAEGTWDYLVRFRSGENVAVADDVEAGLAVDPADGSSGQFMVLSSDKNAPDLRAKGRLEYVGEHYLRFAGNGEWFVKAGPDSPENLLAYNDFDNTPNYGERRKSWSPHISDWRSGDPTWKGGKGKGLIGAINYLSGKGLNTLSFLTMNISGDDRNVFPYLSDSDYSRLDCSKLDQWEVVFSHAEQKGMHLHFKLQETENELVLDNGALGTHRKLYYRELIARFGHHLALSWNLGEESGAGFSSTNQTDAQRIACSRYFEAVDPYRNLVDIHTGGSTAEHSKIYTPLLGDKSAVTGATMQGWYQGHGFTKTWVENSAAAGKKWVVAHDEQGSANHGVPEDQYVGDQDKHDIRKYTLWGNLMAGGAGVEYYFGYERPHSDLSCQDFRYRDESWDYCKIALDFFNLYLPYWEMSNMDGLSSSGWVLGKDAGVYALFMNTGGSATMTLPPGIYDVHWYNPREGKGLIEGESGIVVDSETSVSLGSSPDSKDWVALVRESGFIHEGNQQSYLPCASGRQLLSSFNDFPEFTGIEGMVPAYKDNSRQCLAVNAASYKDQFAAARSTHSGPAGVYNVKITTLKEFDGESTYHLLIDGVRVGSYQNPRTGEAGDMTPADTTWEEIYIPEGALIQVEFNTHSNGLVPEDNGFAYSRGRWTSLELVPLCLNSPGLPGENDDEPVLESQLWVEEDGILVVDVESLEGYAEKNWVLAQGHSHMGAGYLQFQGANSLSAELGENRLVYKIQINNPGDYEFIFRVKQPSNATAGDAWNDSWVNIKADRFYGIPAGQSFATGTKQTRNQPTKAWIQNRASDSFTWKTNGDYQYNGSHYNGTKLGATFNEPGIYEVHITGRSKYHMVDRFVLAMDGLQDAARTQVDESEIIDGRRTILVEGIAAEPAELELESGTSAAIAVTIEPAGASDKELIWTSSDSTVAIMEDGLVKGLRPGYASLTVRSAENASINQVIPVTVSLSSSYTALSLSDDFVQIGNGASILLSASLNPGEVNPAFPLDWSSSNESIVRVSAGMLSGISEGMAWVIAAVPGSELGDTCLVRVGEAGDTILALTLDSLVLATGTQTRLQAYSSPGTYALSWSSSNPAVATIDNEGKLQALSQGMSTIRASMLDERYSAELHVRVSEAYLAFQPDADTMLTGQQLIPGLEQVPADTLLVWESNYPEIASVHKGVVLARKPGDVQIIARSPSGTLSDTLDLHVYEPYVRFPFTSLELLEKRGYAMNAELFPDTSSLSWISENQEVATVDQAGNIMAHKRGSTVVSAVMAGGYRALTVVDVIRPSISLSFEEKDLQVGTSYLLLAETRPDTSVLSWTSDAPDIVSVSDGGIIEAQAVGSANITVSILDGDAIARCVVHAFVPSVQFERDTVSLVYRAPAFPGLSLLPAGEEVHWKSLDESVVRVTAKGLEGLALGFAEVVAGIQDFAYTDTCVVEVLPPEITLSLNEAEIFQTEIVALSATVNAPGLLLEWVSSDPYVATVANGIVKGLHVGRSIVRAQVEGGAYFAECQVDVLSPVVKLSSDSLFLDPGDVVDLDVFVGPAGTPVSWTSDDAGIASVSQGSVTAHSPGSTLIKASIFSRYFADTCVLTVADPLGRRDDESAFLQVYPVPSKGTVYIRSDIPFERIELLNLQGKIMQVLEPDDQRLDLGALPGGVYLLRFTDRDGRHFLRRVIRS